jgi:hypothetical protein
VRRNRANETTRAGDSLSEDPIGIAQTTRKPAILGMGNEPTDETAFSKGGSLTDLTEGTEERENDGTVRSPARS